MTNSHSLAPQVAWLLTTERYVIYQVRCSWRCFTCWHSSKDHFWRVEMEMQPAAPNSP